MGDVRNTLISCDRVLIECLDETMFRLTLNNDRSLLKIGIVRAAIAQRDRTRSFRGVSVTVVPKVFLENDSRTFHYDY